MGMFRRTKDPEQLLAKTLGLKPGDIILSEIPYADSERRDFEKFVNFTPGHCSVWAGDHLEKPFARSHREVYSPPGLQLTNVWEGRHVVYRYKDQGVAELFAKIMENWSSGDLQITVHQVYEVHVGKELLYILENPEDNLGHDGMLMALCFAAMRESVGEPHYKPGQRCTSILTAAFQASLLSSIVKSKKDYHIAHLRKHTVGSFLEEMTESGWQDTPLGKKVIAGIEQNKFNHVFPSPFSIDLHNANPKLLYQKLKTALEFIEVGFFSYFDDELVAVEKSDLDSAA